MQIKKSQLRQLIQEEIIEFLEEAVVQGGKGRPNPYAKIQRAKYLDNQIPRALGKVYQKLSKTEYPPDLWKLPVAMFRYIFTVTRTGDEREKVAKALILDLQQEFLDKQAKILDELIFAADQESLYHLGKSMFEDPQKPFSKQGWQKTT